MSKRKILRGTTSVTVPVFIQSAVDGSGLSGLTSATAGLVCKYRRHAGATWGTITLSAGTLGTWSSGGFIADTSGPAGMYDLHLPDVVFATNSWSIVALYGAANMAPVIMEFELDAINYQDGVRLGLTALPNVAAGANGGLPLSVDGNGRVDVGEWLGVAPVALDSQRVNVSVGFIQNSVVSAAAIATDAITSVKIANNAITAAKIATDAIGSAQMATGAISSATFGTGAITAAAIATNAITSAKIATDAIGAAQLGTDCITSAQISGSAVAEIQGQDPGGVTTLLTRLGTPSTTLAADTSALVSRLTSTRAGNLDNLDATVSSRNATAPPTAAAIRTEIDTNSTKLANLDATVSSRSTYAGADTSGTTTLLSRLSSTRAGNLDNLDTAVSGVPLSTGNTLRSVTFGVGSIGEKFKAWLADLGSDNRVKVSADAHTSGETIAAVSGDTKQTGDAFARIGSGGAGLTALGDSRLANLDVAVSSRNATTPPTVAAIRSEMDSNSTKLANLDATVSSRSTYAGTDTSGTTTLLTRLPSALNVTSGKVDVNDKTGFALTTDEHESIAEAVASGAGGEVTEAGVATAVRTELATELGRLDVAVSSRNATTPPSVAAIRTELDTNSTKLANLDVAVSSRNATTPPTVAAIRSELDSNSTKLANLDATVSSRSTYAGGDTSGTTTLLSRLTSIRAGLLDNLDAAISSVTNGDGATAETVAMAVREELATELARLDAAISTRSTYAGSDTSGTTTLLSRLSSTRASNLDNLDAPISTIESGDGGESSGITTLLERLSETRAGNLDNLDMAISDLPTADEVGDELVGVTVGSVVI